MYLWLSGCDYYIYIISGNETYELRPSLHQLPVI
uniref:Uncharacterized protein n=1 Tax=Lepeophtheirus salmonis TaxID=72036 RepID=A0A0K2TA56_LEPSM